ncbi:MAG TPA: hypothetical protein VF503_33190 [Sphingobium sp.]|uniref:hypothetical protein n=1 Tax=Sphingobium sp. TaxID=1912891 RepID=UPI002ED0ECCF
MKKTRLILAATLAPTLVLAACDKGRKDDGTVRNATITENVVTEVTPPANDAGPDMPANAVSTTAPTDQAIPVAFQGRWGMVPKDCGPDAAIAKGLMTVDGKQLRFYESVGKPAVVNYPTPSHMEGRFSFTGEGMDWSKDMTLTVAGDKLTRTEKDPTASYVYTRCPA